MAPRDPIPPGTLDMLVLQTLARGRELHGFEIAEAIQETSDDVLQVEEGSLYPALYRIELKRWIMEECGVTENNRWARYYKLTKAGRKQLEGEVASYGRLTDAIAKARQTA